MIAVNARRRAWGSRARRPSLEPLEDRFLLYAANGGEWQYPQRITYSFMPDGTNVGGVPSSLFQTMNAVAPTASWEAAIAKAAAAWEATANIDLVQVSDDGSQLEAPGDQQGDPRFGDIRIGAIPESAGQLGFAFLPPPLNGGTDAGDIFFNSKTTWNLTSGLGFDLATVAIHELGHALGMAHSQIQTAVMYGSYTGVKQTLTSDDAAGLAAIYGGVPTTTPGNGTMANATNITGLINSASQIALSGPAEYINSAAEQEYYQVTVPSSTTGSMTVSIQATNFSMLAPRLTIYNGNGQGLAQVGTANQYGSTVSLTISGVTPGQVYYIRAIAANTGPGCVGSYGLLVNFGSQTQSPIPGLSTVVLSQADQGGGSLSEVDRTRIRGLPAGFPDRRGWAHLGSIIGQGDALMGGTGRHQHPKTTYGHHHPGHTHRPPAHPVPPHRHLPNARHRT
jgi:hypothetical protein